MGMDITQARCKNCANEIMRIAGTWVHSGTFSRVCNHPTEAELYEPPEDFLKKMAPWLPSRRPIRRKSLDSYNLSKKR